MASQVRKTRLMKTMKILGWANRQVRPEVALRSSEGGRLGRSDAPDCRELTENLVVKSAGLRARTGCGVHPLQRRIEACRRRREKFYGSVLPGILPK
jgi:hypothetical protein